MYLVAPPTRGDVCSYCDSRCSILQCAQWSSDVRIDPLNIAPAPARVSCASVAFELGARSAWHTHRAQRFAGTGMARRRAPRTHIAIEEALDGVTVEWMRHVIDSEYRAAPL